MCVGWAKYLNVANKAVGEYFYNVLGWNVEVKEGSFLSKMENPEAWSQI